MLRKKEKIQEKKKKTGRNKTPVNPVSSSLGILILVMIFFTLMNINMAKAEPATLSIQVTSQTDPLEYTQIQELKANITSNHTIVSALIEFEGQNHTMQKQSQQGNYTHLYAYSWIPSYKETYTYKIYARNMANQSAVYTGNFYVQDTTPPQITETGPSGMLDYNLIELKAVTNENSTCRYDEQDVSYDSMTFGLSGEGKTHTKLRIFGDGTYLFYVTCKDEEGNSGSSSTISFSIDVNPPQISGITPTGTVNQEQVVLKINTNEQAHCKWDAVNRDYASMSRAFQSTNSKHHEQPLSLSQGINTYYLSCQDNQGNANTPLTLNIELDLPPTASISINKNSSYNSLSYGTYDLTLTSSEPLSQPPSLKLKYSNKQINIPLEGSDEEWNGYLIIPEQAGKHVGEFMYAGYDLRGTVGTEITSGKLVLIDTEPPDTPTSLKLENKKNQIQVSWEYDGEEPDHFNIYRSITGKTSKADYYDESTAASYSYMDSGAEDKIGYYYRVSALDQAGNEGDLSEEYFIMTEYENATSGFEQEPELLRIINNKITELEKTVNEIDVKITELEETTDQDLLLVINEQGLVTQMKKAKNQIELLIGELKTYKQTRISKAELETKISIIDTKTQNYKKNIISEVNIKNKLHSEQVPDQALVYQVANQYLGNNRLAEEQKQRYYEEVLELQDRARIVQEIISYEINYEMRPSQNIIFMQEEILYSDDTDSFLLQEIIPREVVKISRINFSQVPDEINSLGVAWSLKNLDEPRVLYKIYPAQDENKEGESQTTSQDIQLNQLQRIRSVLLYDADSFLDMLASSSLPGAEGTEDSLTNVSGNVLTGKAVAGNDTNSSWLKKLLIPLSIVVVLGLLVYYFLFLKSENYYENQIIKKIDRDESTALKEIRIPGKEQTTASTLISQIETKSSVSGLGLILEFVQQGYEALEQGDVRAAHDKYSLALKSYAGSRLKLRHRLKANFEINTLGEEIIHKRTN